MEENKNNVNILTIILFILLFLSVGVICYLLGSNNAKESNTDMEEEISLTPVNYTPKCVDSSAKQNILMTDIDENKYNNIIEYIQEQQNIKISIGYCNDNPSTSDVEMSNYELNNSEKTDVFNEIKNSDFEISESGIGGLCVSDLKITYERNGKEYNVLYYQLFAMTSNDGNIYKILDKTVNNTLEEPQYCLYNFNNLSSTATSILNKLINN